MHIILRKIRKNKGYTQEDVANAIHVSRQTISNWERGVSLPNLENIRVLSDFYNVSISKIIESEIYPQSHPKVIGIEKSKEMFYFLCLLSIASLVTPLAAFILMYCVLSLKNTQSKTRYLFLKYYALILIGLNLIAIFFFLIHLM